MQIMELIMNRRRCQQPGLIAAAIVLCVSAAFAQESVSVGFAPSRDIGAVALKHLRDDDLGKALEALGEAADQAMPLDLREDGGLSAATGGLHRALVQLSDDEQFELLYTWSMPTDSRKRGHSTFCIRPQKDEDPYFPLGETYIDTKR